MPDSHRPDLSPEELDALREAHSGTIARHKTVDAWFKYRNAFLLTVVGYYVIKLLLYAENTVMALPVHPDDQAHLVNYLRARALFALAASAIYLWSYLRNWRFPIVAIVFATIGLTAMVLNYLSFYLYTQGEAVPWLSWFSAIRLLAVVCLGWNAFNAARAPAMPRRLWS